MADEHTYRSLDDIVFEGRNKEYGAYQLRRSYFFHLKLALGVSVGVVLSIVMLYYIKLRLKDMIPTKKMEAIEWQVEDDIEIPEPEVLPPPPPPPKTQEVPITATKHTDVEVVKKEEADPEEFPDKEKLDTTATGKTTVKGDTSSVNLPPDSKNGQDGPGTNDNNIYFSVDGTDANFPGGRGEMENYLKKNLLHVQKRAQRVGDKGIVNVTFIIEKDGTVSNVRLLNGLHVCESCNEEAKKVIENMPNWTPAENKLGHKVRRQMMLPLNFTF